MASSMIHSQFESASGDSNFTTSRCSMASDSSSQSTISNPEDPCQSGCEEVQENQRPLFQFSSQNCTDDEKIGKCKRSDPDNMVNLVPDTEFWSNQEEQRVRSDSWSHRSRVSQAIAMRVANFKKSATQTNLLLNMHSSTDDLSQQQLMATRRFFNLSNGSSLTTSVDLSEQHPTPPAVEILASSASIVSIAKHVHTELILAKHSLKTHLTKCERLLDAYFGYLTAPAAGASVDEQAIAELLISVSTLLRNAWETPEIGIDLAFGLCTYMRETGYLLILLDDFILDSSRSLSITVAAVRAIQPMLITANRAHIASKLEALVEIVKTRLIEHPANSKDSACDAVSAGVALFEQLFKSDQPTILRLIDISALDYCLNACKTCRDVNAHRHASIALANLCMNSDDKECQQKMMSKNVCDWLYFLASSRDDATRYYACLSVCVLVSNKEIEANVLRSGTLSLVEPFLRGRNPIEFAFAADYRHQGRPKEWLRRLVSMLYTKRREPRMLAAFHLAMDASIKKSQERLDVLREIGAVDALRQAAGMPDEAASEFARRALEIIGEPAPHKLRPQVPLWTVDDVQYWVVQIGFENYAPAFKQNLVDGDLLLLITDEELENDVGMKSILYRKRFMRELESLKMVADYSCVDGTKLDHFLTSINPQFSIYTYPLLELGITDCRDIPLLTDDILRNECRIINPVHRLKLLESFQEYRQTGDMEVAVLKKQIDVFISYRRSTGSQLASLLKVLLQLRGYKVFIDVDRLYAGQFDNSLFKNIQAADHFVLVLTPQSMDRCMNDHECNDWVHKEISHALRFNKNIIPILDPQYEWPDADRLPSGIRAITHFNQVNWVHEYQDACVTKIEKFIKDFANVNRVGGSPLTHCGYIDNRRDMG